MAILISFCLLVLGGINWLSIGMLQYDLIAGIFGTQSNIFSRIIYVIIGAATVFLTYIAIAKKGNICLHCCKCKNKPSPIEDAEEKEIVKPEPKAPKQK